MIAAIALAASLCVVDENGAPARDARVVFVDAAGARDEERAGADCRAQPRDGFRAIAAEVRADGYLAVRVTIERETTRVVLVRGLATVGTVRVATGTTTSLHESPLAASQLDRDAIAASPATTADRLLRALPGFDAARSTSAFTNYGQLRASFSGAGQDRGAVFVDGVPAQDAFGGQIDWQAVPAQTIERAELLRGAGSSLYGSGAVGGVLDVTTFGPRAAAIQETDGALVASAGSDDAADGLVALRGPLGRTVAGSMTATTTRFAYADLAPGYQSPIDTDAESTSGTFALRARYDGAGTSVVGAILAASDHQYEGRPNYTFDRSLRQNVLGASHAFAGGLASVQYYDRDTTVENLSDLYPAKPGTLRYDQHVPTHEEGFAASYHATLRSIDLIARIDERRVAGQSDQTGIGGIFQALGTGVEASQAIVLQADYRAHRVEFNVGVRADRLRYDDLVQAIAASPAPTVTTLAGHAEGAISPRVAARYALGPHLVIRASTGEGFRGPYLNELVRGFNVGAIFEAPNLALVPERSSTASAGLDALLGSGRLAFDLIETRVRDAIAFVSLSPTLMMRENLDRTQTDSETLSYVTPLSACARVRVAATTQRDTVTSGPAATIGKALAYVPQSTVDLGIDGNGRGGLGYGVDAAYVGETYADSAQAQPLGAAFLLGATLRATTHAGTTFELAGDNLTRQRYLSSIDRYGPPQNVVLRVRVPLGPNASAAPSTCR